MKKVQLTRNQIIESKEKNIMENFHKVMGKLDKGYINEGGWNLPDDVSDNDPHFNYEDGPEYNGDYEITDDADNPGDFGITLTDEAGGTSLVFLYQIFDKLNISPEVVQYFEQALQMQPRPIGFEQKLGDLLDKWAPYAEFDNYPEPDYDGSDYEREPDADTLNREFGGIDW